MEGISRFAFAESVKYRQVPCCLLKIRNDFCSNFIPQFEVLLDSSCNHKKNNQISGPDFLEKNKRHFACSVHFSFHKVSQFSTSTINNTDVNLGSCNFLSKYRLLSISAELRKTHSGLSIILLLRLPRKWIDLLKISFDSTLSTKQDTTPYSLGSCSRWSIGPWMTACKM